MTPGNLNLKPPLAPETLRLTLSASVSAWQPDSEPARELEPELDSAGGHKAPGGPSPGSGCQTQPDSASLECGLGNPPLRGIMIASLPVSAAQPEAAAQAAAGRLQDQQRLLAS